MVPVAHFKLVMFKFMEVSFFILVRFLERVANSPWVTK